MTSQRETDISSATAGGLLKAATSAISAAGCEQPRTDAEILVAYSMQVSVSELRRHALSKVKPDVAQEIQDLVSRRVNREPIAYILGRCRFRHIELQVDPRVMIPRSETELLVEIATQLPNAARVHEVGTGSGAVALALMCERPDLRVTASELSPDAAEVARLNADQLGVRLEVTVARGLPDSLGDVDLLLANLPYVTDSTIALRPPEVQFEPNIALVGNSGTAGLGAIRELIQETPPGWRLALEHDIHQGHALRDILRDAVTMKHNGDERMTVGFVR